MGYNLDQALTKVGALGKVQWLVIIVNAINRNAGSFLYYPFAYLTLEQKFVCTDQEDGIFARCTKEEICLAKEDPLSTLTYKVDTGYDYYLQNWFVEMDLVCHTAQTIGFMVIAYSVGYGTGVVFYKLPDVLGRKKSMILSSLLNLVGMTIVMFCPSFNLRTFGFFLMGFAQIRIAVSYVWACEVVPVSKKSISFTVINIIDIMTVSVSCAYFAYVSKNWYTLNFYMLCLSYVGFFCLFLLPESPRWLLLSSKTKEAIEVLNGIAKLNGSKGRIPQDAEFVEDPSNADKEVDASILESQGKTQGQVMEEIQKIRAQKQGGRDETLLDWGNYTAVDPSMMINEVESKIDSFISQATEPSPTKVFTLLLVCNVALIVQYLSISLYISLVPGNKFTNGILFGLAEFFGTILSQILVSNLSDIAAFYITVLMAEVGYMIFILFPTDGLHSYVATVLVMTAIASWLNLSYLLLELRVPPAKASISCVIIRTVSCFTGVVAPTIAAMPHTERFILMALLGGVGGLCGLCLPPAGLYLPATKKIGKNKVQLIDRQTEMTYLDPVVKPPRDTNYSVHSMSYMETFTERNLRVQRVRLNETRLDPDVYIQYSKMYSRMEKDQGSEKKQKTKNLDSAWGVNKTYVDEA